MTIATPVVGSDQQTTGMRIGHFAHFPPPASNLLHCKLRGVVIDADVHPASIGGQVINVVGGDLAQLRIDEVMNPDFFRHPLGLPLLAGVLEVTDQFLLLGIDGNYRIAGSLIFGDRPRDEGSTSASRSRTRLASLAVNFFRPPPVARIVS